MKIFRLLLAEFALTVFALFVFTIAGLSPSSAHEVRPGFLKIDEISPETYAVSWKQPVRGGAQNIASLGLRPVFPASCERSTDSKMRLMPGVLVETFTLICAEVCAGRRSALRVCRKP